MIEGKKLGKEERSDDQNEGGEMKLVREPAENVHLSIDDRAETKEWGWQSELGGQLLDVGGEAYTEAASHPANYPLPLSRNP